MHRDPVLRNEAESFFLKRHLVCLVSCRGKAPYIKEVRPFRALLVPGTQKLREPTDVVSTRRLGPLGKINNKTGNAK